MLQFLGVDGDGGKFVPYVAGFQFGLADWIVAHLLPKEFDSFLVFLYLKCHKNLTLLWASRPSLTGILVSVEFLLLLRLAPNKGALGTGGGAVGILLDGGGGGGAPIPCRGGGGGGIPLIGVAGARTSTSSSVTVCQVSWGSKNCRENST